MIGALGCATAEPDAAPHSAASTLLAEPHVTADSIVVSAPAVLRDQVGVTADGRPERWALVWRRQPVAACGPDEAEMALTCPCDGWAYGERGALDLVRRRPGRPDERLALSPIVGGGENPGKGEAILQRWPVRDSDWGAAADDPDGFASTVRARPATHPLVLGDYDHDGEATEFLLQVEETACGHVAGVLIGVSRANPTLHPFTSVGHPERPLTLDLELWGLLLRSSGQATGVEWKCLDHGSETQTEVTLQTGPGGIDGTRREYACDAGGAKAALLRSERL